MKYSAGVKTFINCMFLGQNAFGGSFATEAHSIGRI